jgi:hypothetical protein
MKIVDEAVRPPAMCLASRDTEGPFIDTGLRSGMVDPHIYISCRWIEEAARELGMVPKVEVDARFAKLEAEHEEYAAKLSALQRLADASAEFSEATEAVVEQSPIAKVAETELPPLVPTEKERSEFARQVYGGGVAA